MKSNIKEMVKRAKEALVHFDEDYSAAMYLLTSRDQPKPTKMRKHRKHKS